jgi:uncharacterized Tic20 family protein
MTQNRNKQRALAASAHALGFLLGLVPGLILWYAYYDKSSWLSRHGLAAARFQTIMLFIYIGLVSLYDRCRIMNKEITLLVKGHLFPLLQRPEAISIAILCALTFVVAWLANLVLSTYSAVAAAHGQDPTYPTCLMDPYR